MHHPFFETPVSELMSTELYAVTELLPLGDAAQLLADRGVTGAPVLSRTGQAVGILSWSDLLAAGKTSPEGAVLKGDVIAGFYVEGATRVLDTSLPPIEHLPGLVRDHMSTHLISVGDRDTVHRAARVMAVERVHRLLVTKSDGTLVGLLSASDIVNYLGRYETGGTRT